ncbi:MAG: hypothetical protein OXE77_07865 [Flavobacteriaceae bacterium]|nr:hypothetical protein [Flavobacteriaceae bacterium]
MKPKKITETLNKFETYWKSMYRAKHEFTRRGKELALNEANEIVKDDTTFRHLLLNQLHRNRRNSNIIATLLVVLTILSIVGMILLIIIN